jgi:hypothetical protein
MACCNRCTTGSSQTAATGGVVVGAISPSLATIPAAPETLMQQCQHMRQSWGLLILIFLAGVIVGGGVRK